MRGHGIVSCAVEIHGWGGGIQPRGGVIVVIILDYCFYLGPALNHPFDDRSEYYTHFCMICS